MKKLTNWIRNHQIVAYFTITFGFTWGLGFSFDAVMNQGVFFLVPLFGIAMCGPALAGIIVTAVSNPQPRQGVSRAPWIAFFLVWTISLLVSLANNIFINQAPLSPAIVVVNAVGVVVPVAFVISMAASRNPAVKNYLSSLIRLRGVWGWSLLALVLIPGLALLSILISSFIGRQPLTTQQLPAIDLALIGLVVVKLFHQLFFFNATGEEVGWRGFALPRLQARTNPLIASLVLAFFWGIWHFFFWQAEGRPIFTLQYWIETYVKLIPATLIVVWISNRAKGSILVAGITHAAANTAFAFLPLLDYPVYNLTLSVVVLVMILADRMWKKLPPDHPAVYREPGMIKLEVSITDETLEVSHV